MKKEKGKWGMTSNYVTQSQDRFTNKKRICINNPQTLPTTMKNNEKITHNNGNINAEQQQIKSKSNERWPVHMLQENSQVHEKRKKSEKEMVKDPSFSMQQAEKVLNTTVNNLVAIESRDLNQFDEHKR